MNFKITASLYKKELLDIFRDKKTIIIMLVVPLLLYPAIFVFAAQISVSVMNETQEKSYTIALDFEESADKIKSVFENDSSEYGYSVKIADSNGDCKKALENKDINAYITAEKNDSGKTVYKIYFLSSDSDSANAASVANDMLLEYRNDLRTEILENNGIEADSVLEPIIIEQNDTASSEQSVGYMLGSILPVVLTVIIVMSATYPATDITAGEKERGTLETLLTLPVSGKEMFASKFLAVSTIAVFSAFVNILSMAAATGFLYTSVVTYNSEISIDISSFIPSAAITGICVIIFAMFISAMTMGICSMAKSFKEAQNYMTPFTLIVMLAGYISFIPSVEFTPSTALVPVLNICLLIKQIFTFEYNTALILEVFVSNLAYAAFSIIILSRIYNSENILFEENAKEIKLFERRANIKSGGTPGIGDAVIVLLLSVIFMIYSSAIIASKLPLIYSVIIPQFFFAAICIASALYLKCDMKKALFFKKPKFIYIISAVIIGLGNILINMVLTSVFSLFMNDSTDEMNQSMQLITDGRPFIQLLFAIGILPAVCEEILFRGYLYSSIKNKMKPFMAMIVVSLTFGIYHMNLIQSAVTAIIGIILVYSVYKTECIFVSMIIHAMNNSFSVICMSYPDNAVISRINEIQPVTGIIIFAVVGILFIFAGFFIIKKAADYKKKMDL